MSTIKQLKEIFNNEEKRHQQEEKIYDLSDPENKFLIVLKRRGLITYQQVYLSNKHIGAIDCTITIGAIDCTITKEGLEYIKTHKESKHRFVIQAIVSALASIITGVTVTLILVYVFHISK